MKRELIGDRMWAALASLLSEAKPSARGGRPRVDDRAAFNGILFILFTGIPRKALPTELGFGSELGRHRWVVERTHAWFAGIAKLRIRFERRLDTHYSLLKIACAVICIRFIERQC